jgi:hypothetical protein
MYYTYLKKLGIQVDEFDIFDVFYLVNGNGCLRLAEGFHASPFGNDCLRIGRRFHVSYFAVISLLE